MMNVNTRVGSRTRNSLLNSLFGASSQLMLAISGFVLQRVFISVFGLEMQGVFATVTSVISMLSLTELGIGAAINCRLYAPLAAHDDRGIASLMQMYGRVYRLIALIVFTVGGCLLPLLPYIVGADIAIAVPHSLIGFTDALLGGRPLAGWLMYGFLLLDSALSYLLAYKRSVIMADQRNYIILSVHTAATVLMQAAQIAVLLSTHDVVLFLILRLFFRLLENGTLAVMADRRYPVIRTRERIPVTPVLRRDIWGNTAALSMHYIGNYAIDSVDMLIINNILGALTAGIYSNYLLITKALRAAMASFSAGFTASFGNLIAEHGDTSDNGAADENLLFAFKKAYFVTFIFTNFATVSLFCLISNFISDIWIGKAGGGDVTLALPVVAVICLNFAMTCLAETLGSLRAAAGLFRPDRYLHLAMAALNLVVSLLLVRPLGVFGVLIGTTLCKVIKEFINLPGIVYHDILHRNPWRYRLRYLAYLATTAVCTALSYTCCSLVRLDSVILTFAVRVIICCVIPNLTAFLLWHKTPEYSYLISLLKRIISRRKRLQ